MGPKITHVAILYKDVVYSLAPPNRHHDVIALIRKDILGPLEYGEQGFLDESGRFLTRKQALVSALANNQVKDPNDIRAGQLFSEDVW